MSQNFDYETANYPPNNDTTASGGYSSSKNPFADSVQRGRTDDSSGGLIDQSLSGGPIGQEIQDGAQGKDAESRRDYAHEVQRDFNVESRQGLNPYGKNPDNKQEASEMLASAYSDARKRDFETGASMEDA